MMADEDTAGAVDGVIKEDSLAGSWADDKLEVTDGDSITGDVQIVNPPDTPQGDDLQQEKSPEERGDSHNNEGAREFEQPPRLEDRGADIGTRPSGFVSEQDAPPDEAEPITPNQALEQAQAQIAALVDEKLKLTRELNESEAEINAYFAAFGPLPTE